MDGLQRALKFSQRLTVGWASWIAEWMCRMRGATYASYYHHAMQEQDFRNRRARHIVYGHTHHPETIALDASYAEGYVLNQLYFNAGTWRRVHHQTKFAAHEHEFIASDTMTFLAFFYGDERKGRPYETWSGNLGIHPADFTIHRIDAAAYKFTAGPRPHASGKPVSSSGVSGHRPHFARPRHSAPVVPTRRV